MFTSYNSLLQLAHRLLCRSLAMRKQMPFILVLLQ